MKRIFWIVSIFFLLWACSGPKRAVKVEKTQAVIENDSLEYGLETFDAKFDTWYALHKSPATYRSQDYYENWNWQYVQAWNARSAGRKHSFFEPIVGYYPNVDYGFDLNHELFYYFQYVENVLKIEILPNSPKSIPL
jgi:hypothetical protein